VKTTTGGDSGQTSTKAAGSKFGHGTKPGLTWRKKPTPKPAKRSPHSEHKKPEPIDETEDLPETVAEKEFMQDVKRLFFLDNESNSYDENSFFTAYFS